VASITIAILIRKVAAGITLSVPSLLRDIEVVSGTHAQCTEIGSDTVSNLGKKSLLETIRNIVFALPRNIARVAF
jgi:hypothetical protein